mmetsp:Transcript_14740/g.21743  ORF Transcript_14740/g.21743 Transcript_14740/m.21743 type:complete len:298 (+) Transcript_14740:44-937(+)
MRRKKSSQQQQDDGDEQHNNNNTNEDIPKMDSLLPLFRPAFGCTDTSDFLVRSFVVRLRTGIRVIKHAHSPHAHPRSQVRILHLHSDGKSITWSPEQLPAADESSSRKFKSSSANNNNNRSSKNTNKKKHRRGLDLTTCREVRYALGPRPLFHKKGTKVLRECCHHRSDIEKSFSLHFPGRTLDITAATTDQCQVLLNGFSALCFRLRISVMNMNANANAEKHSVKADAGHTSSPTNHPVESATNEESTSAESSSSEEENVPQQEPEQEEQVFLVSTRSNERSSTALAKKKNQSKWV